MVIGHIRDSIRELAQHPPRTRGPLWHQLERLTRALCQMSGLDFDDLWQEVVG
jgi:hypothetical protein